jgi:two-component system nitrogen regulation response regulator NtrX
MAPERLDMELFGEEGEGGRPRKIGVFERAHGGTLYIDEVIDMPRESQSRILRVLVEQRFRRVGGDQDVQVDVRVVSPPPPRTCASEIPKAGSARTCSIA